MTNLEATEDGKWIVYYVEEGKQLSQIFEDNNQAATFYGQKM
jgi:cell envelope opacity-associated protein A